METVLPDGTLVPTPFIDLRDETYAIQDHGLLSVAIDPDFPASDCVYVMYVVDPNEDGVEGGAEDDKFIRVSRYRYHAVFENVADVNSREDLIGAG